MKEFQTAKMDNLTKVITVILVIFLPSLALSSFFMEPAKPIVSVFLTLLLVGVIIFSYGFVPKRIALSASHILIKNFYGPVLIDLKEIKNLEKIDKTGFNLRTFGVGGLFGYFDYFNGGDIWYVTNIHKKVKITLNSGQIYMISPEKRDDFLNLIAQQMNLPV